MENGRTKTEGRQVLLIKLYNGITEQTIAHMKELVRVSDYMVPNYTEAAYLAGMKYNPEGMTRDEAKGLIRRLQELGARSMIITSARVEHQDMVILYDHTSGERHFLPFTSIPVRFPGTGDIFSAVFMGRLLEGQTLLDSTKNAMDTVSTLIDRNKDNKDKLDMMVWAGQGVAVANAPEDVRGRADEVTASNDEDGVGHWIRRYLEERKS